MLGAGSKLSSVAMTGGTGFGPTRGEIATVAVGAGRTGVGGGSTG